MRLYSIAIYLFLYVPIFIIVLLSFNADDMPASYEVCLSNGTGKPSQTRLLWTLL